MIHPYRYFASFIVKRGKNRKIFASRHLDLLPHEVLIQFLFTIYITVQSNQLLLTERSVFGIHQNRLGFATFFPQQELKLDLHNSAFKAFDS